MFLHAHILLKFLSLVLVGLAVSFAEQPEVEHTDPILPEVQEQYPFLSCARSTRHFAQKIRWGQRHGRTQFRVDAWDQILTYELRQTRERLQTIESDDPALLDRLKKIRAELSKLDGTEGLRLLFPYALVAYEPSAFWWDELRKRAYGIRPMTMKMLREYPVAEFSKMLADFDFNQILVNLEFDFDMWLPSRVARNVIDPDTTLVQALASAYFHETLAEHPTEAFLAFLRERATENPDLNAAIRLYEAKFEDVDGRYETFAQDAWIVLREKWALKEQMAFYALAKARDWPVNSPVLERIGQMNWNSPPMEFMRAFAFYHEVEVQLAQALWDEDVPSTLLPPSPRQPSRR